MKHALHTYQVELNILDEKLKTQNQSVNSLKTQSKSPLLEQLGQKMALLEKKLSHFEAVQEKIAADLRQLNQNLTKSQDRFVQFEKEIAAQNSRLDEVVKLKSTLNSISKAISPKASSDDVNERTYKVKGGDSLEKIARAHHTSVSMLKKLNQIDNDRIQVDQILKLPSDER